MDSPQTPNLSKGRAREVHDLEDFMGIPFMTVCILAQDNKTILPLLYPCIPGPSLPSMLCFSHELLSGFLMLSPGETPM